MKHRKINITFFVLISLVLSINFSSAETSNKEKSHTIKKGILDLSDWQPEKFSFIILQGDWFFYPHKIINPQNIRSEISKEKNTFLYAPGLWNNYKLKGKRFNGRGYGTYAARIILPREKRYYSLKIPEMSTAFAMYINGEKYASNGTVGKDSSESIPEYRPINITFFAPEREIFLVFHISNFHHIKGGMWDPVILGSDYSIRMYTLLRIVFELFLFGALFLMGLYHLVLFLQRKDESAALYLALFCLTISIRTLFVGEHVFHQLVPIFPWIAYILVEYITFPLATISCIKYFDVVFKDMMSKFIIRLLVYSSVLFIVLIIFTPPMIFMNTLLYYQFIPLIGLAYLIPFIIWATIKKIQYAKAIMMGLIGLAAGIGYEYLYINQFIHDVRFVNTGSFGFFIFIFSQIYILSDRFKGALNTAESLTQDLEQKVTERTHDLEKAIQSIKQSMDFARTIQRSTIPKELPPSEKYEISTIYEPAETLGGDFYNFHIPNSDSIGLFIADVTGHGIPAALIASIVYSIFNILTDKAQEPAQLLNEMNSKLMIDIADQMITGSYLFLDTKNMQIKFSRAGHEPMYIYRRSENRIEKVMPKGIIMGYVNEINLEQYSSEVSAGDRIILYTDCVIEASNQKGEIFGSRFLDFIIEQKDKSPKVFTSELQNTLHRWAGKGMSLNDDLTVIVIDIL